MTNCNLDLQDSQYIRDAYAGRLWPDEQVHAFSHTEQMFPTRRIRRGSSAAPLPVSEDPLDEFSFESGGTVVDLYDYSSRNRIAGLVVMKRGRVVLERYELGISADTKWMSMSMAKSISSTLVGAAIADGYIDHVDDPLIKYVPELEAGGYRDVTIRQLLRMTSGVQWNESHTDPQSERRHVLELQLSQQPGIILEFMSRLPKVAPAGSRWNYSTGETHIVGVLLHAATRQWLADYLADKIWSRIGMEADGAWWLEAPGGLEIAGSGISATLRDYARFGQFIAGNGRIAGEQILPNGWVDESGAGHSIDGEPVDYGYMWWLVPSGHGRSLYNGFCARGIFGQRIYINRPRDLVVVMLSARSKPMYSEVIADIDFFNAISEQL